MMRWKAELVGSPGALRSAILTFAEAHSKTQTRQKVRTDT